LLNILENNFLLAKTLIIKHILLSHEKIDAFNKLVEFDVMNNEANLLRNGSSSLYRENVPKQVRKKHILLKNVA
jgi:hypothetical protein